MKRITILLTEKTAKASYYSVLINQEESHLFEVRSDDEDSSMTRMLDFIKEICNRFEDNLQ